MSSDAERIEAELAEFSYLWTSGEWSLCEHRRSRTRIFFLFATGCPNVKELFAVRTLLPRFAHAPVTLLKAEVGNTARYFAGEYSRNVARPLVEAAQKLGLQTETEDASFTSYLPVSSSGNAMIIEDEELALRVAGEMLRHEVPVVLHTESD